MARSWLRRASSSWNSCARRCSSSWNCCWRSCWAISRSFFRFSLPELCCCKAMTTVNVPIISGTRIWAITFRSSRIEWCWQRFVVGWTKGRIDGSTIFKWNEQVSHSVWREEMTHLLIRSPRRWQIFQSEILFDVTISDVQLTSKVPSLLLFSLSRSQLSSAEEKRFDSRRCGK